MDDIFLYNTLTRKKEKFMPIDPAKIGLYTCGPTVYNFAHIGNLRAYIFSDILDRTLRYNYGQTAVKWVMNITDVDDKTIRDSKLKYPDLEPMEALNRFTGEYERIFWDDTRKLNINKPDIVPHAADREYVEKMQVLTKSIVDAGYAYGKDGSVYFNVAKYAADHKYGKLTNIDMDGFRAGARVDADEYEKENVQDFVLWKGCKDGEPYWDFELNGERLPGRPGWHIECSAMGQSALGMPFDIHTGGIDLKFPHHENEIAQSVIGYDTETPVNYWLHNEYLLVDGVKMSKRFKNFYTLRDIEEKGFEPLAFRFLCMQTNYGKHMNFTFDSLKAAKDGLEHLNNQIRELSCVPAGEKESNGMFEKSLEFEDDKCVNFDRYKDKFLRAINDDLNTPMAMAVLQEVLKSDLKDDEKLALAMDFDKVLGLNLSKLKSIKKELDTSSTSSSTSSSTTLLMNEGEVLDEEIEKLLKARVLARMAKNWAESDRLRKEIEKLGWTVEDTPEGQRVFKK